MKKKTSVQKLRNQCDKLLTPAVKKMYPKSILSGEPTEVAHHFIKKSKSTALRYYLPNLIPLTHKEHLRLHCNESYWSGVIIKKKGIEWFKDLEKKKNQIVKADKWWYEEQLNHLKETVDN